VSGSTLTVAGLTVDVSSITLDTNVIPGTTVTVTGVSTNNVIVAQSVVIVIVTNPTPESTSEATPEATVEVSATPVPNSDVIIVVEGPVVNIVNNIITIYSFDIEVEPAHPILNIVNIGDFVHVEGAFGSTGVIVATVVSNISNTVVVGTGNVGTVGLDGPVEAINGNILLVNGIPVQLASNDPLLQTVQVGDFVTLDGNFEGTGSNIVLVVVNIVIVNNVIIDGNPLCWFHEGMGMGHWHCDGMGMGMGMGMGEGSGSMGMGG
jgi:hypothetical protein